MSVIIVAGPPCAGKSTFIKKNFPDRTVIDVYDYQQSIVSVESVMQSYYDCKDALVLALQRGESVVLEHTLLKAKRRPMYIDAIRSITDQDIDIYFIVPNLETYIQRQRSRNCYRGEEDSQMTLDIIELPTKEEGFNNVYIIIE